MSAAKEKMREKKLRNQPVSVQYSAGHTRNGGDSAGPGGPKTPHQRFGRAGRHQKDSEGFSMDLPKAISAGAFAKARAAEVSAMLKAVSKTTASCRLLESLPKHMRRRSMSHNKKRLPRRLRDMADQMQEKSLKAGSKNKEQVKRSRKARRRHGKLLLEFNRRQRKNKWLETHIWHAKRFIVVKKWGYCLGVRPTNKCYRPSYRAMSNHCLLQDLSYYCCIELQGEEGVLLASLSQLTNKDAGPTFASAVSLSGQRQGSVVLYRAGQYPLQPLGPVTFLWRPQTAGSTHRHLWIWLHPTIKKDLLPELQNVCQCFEVVATSAFSMEAPSEDIPDPKCENPNQAPEVKPKPGTKRKRTGKDDAGPPAKKIIGDGTRSSTTPITWKSSSTGIIINDLTMEILRFRLVGPQSLAVIAETFKAALDCDRTNKSRPSFPWWSELCKDESKRNLHQEQADIYGLLEGIHLTGEPPPGTVLGLTVDDPRLTLPTKRVKALQLVKQDKEADEERKRELMLRGVPKHCCQSYLWEQLVRDEVTEQKIPEQELNRLKSEVLVPGSGREAALPQSQIPILLVHQPGKQSGHELRSWGAGWDLLLPKGWGMAFWVPLVYRGVRNGGLDMILKQSQITGVPHFPHDYPDCPSGRLFQDEQEKELVEKFKRRPPAKRTNYIKQGCLAPFRCPWQQLAEEWELISSEEAEESRKDQTKTTEEPDKVMDMDVTSQSNICVTKPVGSFSVLRSRKSLRLLSNWCQPSTSKGQRLCRVGKEPPLTQSAMASFLTEHKMSLVWVRLSMLSKGTPELHAMVCVPTVEDLQELKKGLGSSGPQEPPHKDHFKNRIRQRKKESKKKAATSTLAEKSEKSQPSPDLKPNPTTSKEPEPSSQSSSDLVFGLWPDPLPSVSSHCSRVTIGWVTQGDFFLSVGCGEALGFVSVAGLLKTLISQPVEHRGILLLRNPTSLHYRFVKVNLEV